jgi:hypothetical protein
MNAMPTIQELPITEQARTLIATSIANYQRHARLNLSVDTLTSKVAWCTAHQAEPAVNGRVFTEAEILERATEAFAPLKEEGIEPIICVYTVADGDPMKSVTKHRLPPVEVVRGQKTAVLRIAQPRVLFTQDESGQLFLIEIEHLSAGHFFEGLRAKAKAWLKRSPFRKEEAH